MNNVSNNKFVVPTEVQRQETGAAKANNVRAARPDAASTFSTAHAQAPLASAQTAGAFMPSSASVDSLFGSSAVQNTAATDTPKYDPANANLFPALSWLDPASYKVADPSKLPYQQQNEIDIVKAAQAQRTPQQDAIALDLANRGTFSMWMDYADQYGSKAGWLEGMKLKAKLALALGVDGVADAIGKNQSNEPRPFQVDPSITPVGGDPGGTSYPSGHAASAYAAATVLASYMPDRAAEFFQAAANVARSRVYLGVHFAGDVAAGAQLGMGVGSKFAED